MRLAAGIDALAVGFPEQVRTNDYFRQHHAALVAAAEARASVQVWTPEPAQAGAKDLGPFLQAMQPYLRDPFRGTVERRALGQGDSIMDYEADAAVRAVAAAKLTLGDIDLLICSSFVGEQVGGGHAAFLARRLGLVGAAFNLESTCAGGMVALHTACAMVASQQARRVLVVTSCNYTRCSEETDSLSWICGDGAAALVVGPAAPGLGVMGKSIHHTADTCGAMYFELAVDAAGVPKICMRNSRDAGKRIRASSEQYVVQCCQEAATAAGIELSDVQHFLFNTPTAWYMQFCAQALGIDPQRCIDTYPRYGNIGPVLTFANLHALALSRGIKAGDWVLMFGMGSVSSAAALMLRWGDMALG